MKCHECGCSDGMLHRTGEIGSVHANWTCLPCIELTEPELADNIKDDYLANPIMKDLEAICTNAQD